MIVFYKEVKRQNEECEHCHKQGVRYKVVRWVYPEGHSFVAGRNVSPSYYCSKNCMMEEEKEERYVKVRENSIAEINALGYQA
ncbi:MAG: hypothetical protein WC239_10770 [Sphaerochaetaceae bacterium]